METFSVPPLLGAEIMDILGLDALSIRTPEYYRKYTEIAEFFGRFEDATSILRMITRGTIPKERLAKVHEYTNLRKQLDDVRGKIKDLPSDNLATSNPTVRQALQTQEHALLTELAHYES